MTIFLFAILAILDFVVLAGTYFLFKKWKTQETILPEITYERQLIKKFCEESKTEINEMLEKNKSIMTKVTHLAAEIEKEVIASSDVIATNIENVVNELTFKFETPLQELHTKQQALELLYTKIEQIRERANKVIVRGEKICHVLDKQFSYEELCTDFANKKYSDIRQLLAKGVPIETIASELHILPSEVSLIKDLL